MTRRASSQYARQYPPYFGAVNSLGFGRGLFIQTLKDIGAVIFGAIFISVMACSLPLALFMLIFCEF